METLFVYSMLYIGGIECYEGYKDALDNLLLSDPSDELLLDLQRRNYKDAMLHLYDIFKKNNFDADAFGKSYMSALLPMYQKSDLSSFARRAFGLWGKLPDSILMQEPFHTFSYADECLAFGDEAQCRKLYEKAFSYYL